MKKPDNADLGPQKFQNQIGKKLQNLSKKLKSLSEDQIRSLSEFLFTEITNLEYEIKTNEIKLDLKFIRNAKKGLHALEYLVNHVIDPNPRSSPDF